MLNQICFTPLDNQEATTVRGGFLGLEVVTAFAILSVISILIYKIFGSKTTDITLPGGFKFKLG